MGDVCFFLYIVCCKWQFYTFHTRSLILSLIVRSFASATTLIFLHRGRSTDTFCFGDILSLSICWRHTRSQHLASHRFGGPLPFVICMGGVLVQFFVSHGRCSASSTYLA
jgi:hypothetical protein